MTQEQAITPPPELALQWFLEAKAMPVDQWVIDVATQAARWGSDQELEECCEYVREQWFEHPEERIAELRAARRPKPPSLAAEALTLLDDASTRLDAAHENTIRRALERLQELENNG